MADTPSPSETPQTPSRPEEQLRWLEERLRLLDEKQRQSEQRFQELQERLGHVEPPQAVDWPPVDDAREEGSGGSPEEIAAHEATEPGPVLPDPIPEPPRHVPSRRPAAEDEEDDDEPGQEDEGGRMALWQHLEELRWVLLKALAAVVACSLLGLAFATQIQAVLMLPIEHANANTPYKVDFHISEHYLGQGQSEYQAEVSLQPATRQPIELRYDEPASAFMVSMKIGLFGGLFLALPFVVYFLWSFISPGLRDQERRLAVRASAAAAGLFLAGAAFGYGFLYLGIPAMAGFAHSGVANIWSYESYLSFSFMMVLAFGVAFELPLAVLVVVRLGLVTTRTLASLRPYVIVAILVVAAILTPPDVISQISMAVPMWLLFEVSLFYARRYDAPPEPEEEEEAVTE